MCTIFQSHWFHQISLNLKNFNRDIFLILYSIINKKSIRFTCKRKFICHWRLMLYNVGLQVSFTFNLQYQSQPTILRSWDRIYARRKRDVHLHTWEYRWKINGAKIRRNIWKLGSHLTFGASLQEEGNLYLQSLQA